MMSRSLLPGLAVVAGLAGCNHQTPSSKVPDFSVPVCVQERGSPEFDCNTQQCGGNSPVVNGFPVNGFSKEARGACNSSGVQLLPHSLQGGDCGSGADLGLDPSGTRLIGSRNGKVVCTGEELTGASFLVRSSTPATVAFTITSVRPIVSTNGAGAFEGYRIESGGGSACEPATALRIRRQLGLVPEVQQPAAALPVPAGYQFGPHDDLVIAVDGPLYDEKDRLVAGSRDHWFNLACAGDALAKRSLYGLYLASDDARNDTALRMLTANYCGKPYTVPGVELEWKTSNPAPEILREEAMWQGGKALCIGTPRLITVHVAKDNQLLSPADLPAQLQPGTCRGLPCDADGWTQALRTECHLPACNTIPLTPPPQFEFESFDSEGDQNRIAVARQSPRTEP
jgi:hypothetical protein